MDDIRKTRQTTFDRTKFRPAARRHFKEFDAWLASLHGVPPAADFLRAALPSAELRSKSRRYRKQIAEAAAALRRKLDHSVDLDKNLRVVIEKIENASFYYLLTGQPRALSWAMDGVESLEACPRRYFTSPINVRNGAEIDLCTAAVIKALGIMRAAFDPILDAAVRSRLSRMTIERALRPALEGLRMRGYWWTGAIHNWRSVMTGSFAMGAMAFSSDFKEWAEVVEYGIDGILTILEVGAPEGGWNEGPDYWEYGIVHCAEPAFFLRALSRGKVDLFKHPFLSRTGDFRSWMTVQPGRFWNWSDCHKKAGPSICLAILARVYRNRGWQRTVRQEGIRGLKMISYFDSTLAGSDKTGTGLSKLFPSVGVIAMRNGFGRGDEYVGLKAGSVRKAVNHCHLDLGSIVVFAGDRELLAENELWPYAQVMTRKTPPFGNSRAGGSNDSAPDGRRWNFDGNAGISHNLLTLGTDYPRRDLEGTARITQCDLGPKENLLVVDVSPYYRPAARRVRRYVAYLRPGAIVLVDEVRAERKLKARVLFHFLMKARLDVDRFCIQHGNAQFAGQSLCPSREHNLVLGIDRRSSTYHTENGPVHAENQYVYVENLHRDTRLVFVSALAFGKKPLRPPEFKLVGDPFEQDRFAVEVVRGRSTARVEFDLKKGTVRSAGRRQPY